MEKVPTKSSAEEPVRQHIDQIGEDDAKILSNISTQALSLLILLGLSSGMIANLYFT